MGESLLSSQTCADLEVGLPNPPPIESAPVCISHNSKRLRQTGKTWLPSRLRSSNASKIYHLKECTTLGFSSRLFLVPKPGKKWRPVIDLSVLNSYLQENVPVQGSAFRFSNSTTRVHADCKRSEARASVSRNSSSPIPGRLVVKGKLPTPVHEPDKRTPSYSPGTGVRDKLRKVRTRTYTKNRFPWLPFRSVSRSFQQKRN